MGADTYCPRCGREVSESSIRHGDHKCDPVPELRERLEELEKKFEELDQRLTEIARERFT